MQLSELEEIRLEAYDNSVIYKGKAKAFHDAKLTRKHFDIGDKVMLYNSKLHLFLGKLRSRWLGPFEVLETFPHGAMVIRGFTTNKIFKVNGHRLKVYHQGEQVAKV